MKSVVPILLALILIMNFLLVIRVFKLDEKIQDGFRETEYFAAVDGEFISSNEPNELMSKLEMKNVKTTNNGNIYKITGDIKNTYNQIIEGCLFAQLYEDSGNFERVAILLPDGGLFPQQTFTFKVVVETDLKITKDGWGVVTLNAR